MLHPLSSSHLLLCPSFSCALSLPKPTNKDPSPNPSLTLDLPLLHGKLDKRVPYPRESQDDHGQVGGDGSFAHQQQLEGQGRGDEPGVEPVRELAEEAQGPDQQRPQDPVGVEHGQKRQGKDVEPLGGLDGRARRVDAPPRQLRVDRGQGDLAEDDDEVEDDEKGLRVW